MTHNRHLNRGPSFAPANVTITAKKGPIRLCGTKTPRALAPVTYAGLSGVTAIPITKAARPSRALAIPRDRAAP